MADQLFPQIADRINGRTVAIVCQGPSAPFVKEVGRKEWCYASINRARLIEDLCPAPLEIVYCVSALRLKQEAAWLDDFSGIVISAENADGLLKKPFVRLVSGKGKSGRPIMNTLSVFLFLLLKMGVKDILLFGCDGTGNTYYREEEYSQSERDGSVLNDSMVMNKHFQKIAKEVAPEWKGSIQLVGPTKEFSKVTCFPTIGAEELDRLYPRVPATTTQA